MANPTGLSAPGRATYDSGSLHVGDGTWDAGRDTFLLPNIQGLPFDEMRYNGMGNRFASLQEYHSLIKGHGIVAAITFLVVVPAAILIARFYHQDGNAALRAHISLQILTVLLTTVIFVLGYFAVGPERSLTNPHHGIGLAIYVAILVQFLGGWLIHKLEKGKMRYYKPIKLMLHQWLGRAIALLAFAQIPIGLTLYGSPKYLFVLYSLWMAGLIILYFILTYLRYKRFAAAFDDHSSYVTQTDMTQSTDPRGRRTMRNMAGAVAGGAGIAALRRRISGRHQRTDSDGHMIESAAPSQAPTESIVHEKFAESSITTPSGLAQGRADHSWRNRLFGGAATIGGFAAAKSYFDRRIRKRKDEHDDEYDHDDHDHDNHYQHGNSGPYRPAPAGAPINSSTAYVNRMEEGLPIVNPVANPNDHWHRVEQQEAAQAAAQQHHEMLMSSPSNQHPPMLAPPQNQYQQPTMSPPVQAYQPMMSGARVHRRESQSSIESYSSVKSRRNRLGFGNLGALAGLGGLGAYFKKRREDKEQRRIAAMRQREDEDSQRLHSSHPTQAGQQQGYESINDMESPPQAQYLHSPPTANTTHQTTNTVGPPPQQPYFGPPAAAPPPTNIPIPPPPSNNMPPPPPAHDSTTLQSISTTSPQNRLNRPPRRYSASSNVIAPPEANLANDPFLAGPGLAPPPLHPYHSRTASGSSIHQQSPPVSVKVKMHSDGRHVTLRRLPEEETARIREARAREQRNAADAATAASMDSPTDSSFNQSRYRRAGGANTPYAASGGLSPMPAPLAPSSQLDVSNPPGVSGTPAVHQQPSELHLPSPPAAVPLHSATASPSAGIGGSPGAGPHTSDISRPDESRRRRRIERARAGQARDATGDGGGGRHVDFS